MCRGKWLPQKWEDIVHWRGSITSLKLEACVTSGSIILIQQRSIAILTLWCYERWFSSREKVVYSESIPEARASLHDFLLACQS